MAVKLTAYFRVQEVEVSDYLNYSLYHITGTYIVPSHFHLRESISTFHMQLKCHLLDKAFPDYSLPPNHLCPSISYFVFNCPVFFYIYSVYVYIHIYVVSVEKM